MVRGFAVRWFGRDAPAARCVSIPDLLRSREANRLRICDGSVVASAVRQHQCVTAQGERILRPIAGRHHARILCDGAHVANRVSRNRERPGVRGKGAPDRAELVGGRLLLTARPEIGPRRVVQDLERLVVSGELHQTRWFVRWVGWRLRECDLLHHPYAFKRRWLRLRAHPRCNPDDDRDTHPEETECSVSHLILRFLDEGPG